MEWIIAHTIIWCLAFALAYVGLANRELKRQMREKESYIAVLGTQQDQANTERTRLIGQVRTAEESLKTLRTELSDLKVVALGTVVATAKHLRRQNDIVGLHTFSNGIVRHDDRNFWDFYWRHDQGLVNSDEFRGFTQDTNTSAITDWLITAGSTINADMPKAWSEIKIRQANCHRYEAALEKLIVELASTSKNLNAALQRDNTHAVRQDLYVIRRDIDAALLLTVLESTTLSSGYGWLDQATLKAMLRDHADPTALGDSIAKHTIAKDRKNLIEAEHRAALLDFITEARA